HALALVGVSLDFFYRSAEAVLRELDVICGKGELVKSFLARQDVFRHGKHSRIDNTRFQGHEPAGFRCYIYNRIVAAELETLFPQNITSGKVGGCARGTDADFSAFELL